MRKLFLLAIMVLFVPFATHVTILNAAEANVDFENEGNFDVYSAGSGKIHVKVFLFSERGYDYNAGRGQNQHLGNNPDPICHATGSRIHTKLLKNDQEAIYIHYWADNYYNNTGATGSHHWPKDKGVVWVQLWGGVIECTNTFDGTKRTIVADGTVAQIELKREDKANHFTWFEFDWYPPEELDEEDFRLYVTTDHHKWNQAGFSTKTYDFGVFTGSDMEQAPIITEPFFYAANDKGAAGYGKLAYVYSLMTDVSKYYTSEDDTPYILTEQSDMLFVQPADTVIRGFRNCFWALRSADKTTWRWVWSNKVDVPAYHKIYDFQVGQYIYYREDIGKWYEDYRFKNLTWQVKYPTETDAIEGDYFEIQRAYKADYSDAKTIELVEMSYDSAATVNDIQTYSYLDSTEAAWWNPVENSYNVYYRIRRASSSVWEGNANPLAATGYLEVPENRKYNMLEFFKVDINPNPVTYELDNNFSTNRAVHFKIVFYRPFRNEERTREKPGYSLEYFDPQQKVILRKIMVERNDTFLIEIPKDSIKKVYNQYFYAPDQTYTFPSMSVYYTDYANTPCMHYKYEMYIDTTDVTLKGLNGREAYILPVMDAKGPEIYYTEAANISAFEGTDKEYSEYVLLTWDATEGDIGTYKVEARPNNTSEWTQLADGLTQNWYKDLQADPMAADPWQYRLTMTYACNGTTLQRSAETTGSRNPYGKISGRIRYADGTGCPGVEVNASRVSDGVVLQRVTTDESGYYMLDSVPYGGSPQYAVTPVSQTAEFRYNNTSATFATITLSLDHCISTGIDFENISSVRMSGRVLYENSTIPVRDANFLLNGKIVKSGGNAYRTDASGNFEFLVPKDVAFTIQAVKDGHRFAGDGFVRIEGDSLLTLSKALDGVRIYDQTKVRLIGRLAGGNTQASKPLGHHLSMNYLGQDLKMVFELEGDNISQIVHFPSDPDKDTVHQRVDSTATLIEKKRITVCPDVVTGEYAVDLFPVRYKITQATARGYATLFADGKTSETLDLSDAAKQHKESVYEGDTVHYNESYCITYHSPINISCTQLRFGLEVGYYGEEIMRRKNIKNENLEVPLATKKSDGTYEYLFGAPVFDMDYYNFRVTAHEDYYYNNDPTDLRHEEVRIKGGKLKVYNGMRDAANTEVETYELDMNGQKDITIPVNYVSFMKTNESALRVLDLSVEYEGRYIESQAIRAYVAGNKTKGKNFVSAQHGDIILLDILRDPPGSQSYSFIEEGTTYKYNYTYTIDCNFGLEIGLGAGISNKLTMGSYLGNPAGLYTGYVLDFSKTIMGYFPIVSNYFYKHGASYTFQTTSRIETDNEKYFVDQTGNGKYFVGQEADVYIGAIRNVYNGITDAVKPIDSLTYAALKIQEQPDGNGTLKTVATGRDKQGKLWYFVVGEETEFGIYIDGTFVYTHDYIEHNLLPSLLQRRNSLLLTCDSVTARQIADAQQKQVYWSRLMPDDADFSKEGTYVCMKPTGSSKQYSNEVQSLNEEMAHWLDLFVKNEEEKINAIYGYNSQKVGTWSVSGGTLVTHTETYEYSNNYTKRVDYPGVSFNPTSVTRDLFKKYGNEVNNLLSKLKDNDDGSKGKEIQDIYSQAPEWTFKFSLTPILDVDWSYDPNHGTTHTKKIGFVLEPDNFGHESVSVYRVVDSKKGFNADSEDTRDFLVENSSVGNKSDNSPDSLYGSYVYFLEGGASRCPFEPAYSTGWYTPSLPLSNGTLNIENQKLDINVHERSNVPADQPAIFQLRLTNESEGNFGGAALPITFYLKQKEGTNPKGARLMIDGMPLTGDGRAIKIYHNEIVTKTMMVYAGDGYDYEDITLELASPCDPYNKSACTFSVHYMPVSCPVNITAPRDTWVMNTLSSQDSVGYFLPVSIDGFDVNYNGFDHIELQYKLSTQSDDGWVNLCSYYANDSLYNAASGNKAMIKGGRIDNVHFYGERDPMEQQYDLRAVSFCRYGSGFINRASTVLTGIKDTRPPRVFGQPEPANSILSIGSNLLLRFNEPIAGNYLDEDDNFQLLGVTNDVGLTTGASLAFAGNPLSYAETKVNRSLADKSFSIDLMVKPVGNVDEMFFMHGDGDDMLLFGKTSDNRLVLHAGFNDSFISKPLASPMTAFTRVIVTYNHETGDVRFYAGTMDVTDYSRSNTKILSHTSFMPFFFGMGYEGNMLEARIWTKALTQAEIANTANHYLTGYERELLAYYPMNEGKGETLTDKANGATLYTRGTSWALEKGISLHLTATDSVDLAGDLLSRSEIQDETLMFWFKADANTGTNASLLTAASGFRLALENGNLVLYSGNESSNRQIVNRQIVNGEWHHFVLTVNRTFNNVSVFIDGDVVLSMKALDFGSISGRMYLGGGFEGNIDELAVFEQALPKSLVEEYASLSPYGDEMGLMAFLPFEQMKENQSGIYELVFSPNDRRIFKDSKGNVLNKIVPLVSEQMVTDAMKDKVDHAPVHSHGQLTKLHFDWSFNNDELIINILNKDNEINKQSVYITVRNVEDLNGNPMASPVTWTAFVDHNSLKWEDDDMELYMTYGDPITGYEYRDFQIVNNSGMRHQYTIESLPSWLTMDRNYGTIKPMEDKFVRFYYNTSMPPGKYMDIVYLTDEEGLSEPLEVTYIVEALPPYSSVDKNKYPLNMSVCGQVVIADHPDANDDDKLYVLYRNECVGMANVNANANANPGEVFLTIYGNESMGGKDLNFLLWQASTGKTLNLTPNREVPFLAGSVVGCRDDQPVIFASSGAQTQNITLDAGWSWVSFNLDVQTDKSPIRSVMSAAEPWTDGDIIKNPATQQFVSYSNDMDAFIGMFKALDYHHVYMVYAKNGNIMRVSGNQLTSEQMNITIKGNGAWSPLPCLLDESTPISEALAGYYDYAAPGDLVKAHNSFAVFSSGKRWIGDLQTLRPGEGYLFQRLADGDVTVPFYNRAVSPQQSPSAKRSVSTQDGLFTNPKAATNMTMIAAIEGLEDEESRGLEVYIDDDLVGVAEPLSLERVKSFARSIVRGTVVEHPGEELFYFLTIQSDKAGTLDFRTADGTPLSLVRVKSFARSSVRGTVVEHPGEGLFYEPDAHFGSLESPIMLMPTDDNRPYKIIDNNHVIIIRNNEKYDVTGKKL